jgi:hypothetical protein
MLLTYFLNDFEMVPVAPIITGITIVFTFHMRCISIVRSLYFKIFSAFFNHIIIIITIIIMVILSWIFKKNGMSCVVCFHPVHSEDQQQTLRTRQRTFDFHKITD